MNFALLGGDPAALPLVNAILAEPEHHLTHVSAAGTWGRQLKDEHATLHLLGTPEELLGVSSVQAVIVTGADEDVLETAERLAERGRSLLLVPTLLQGGAFAYTMDIARADSQARLLPLFPRRVHPLVCKLRKLIDEGQLGPVQAIEMQHHVPTTEGREEFGVTQHDVDRTLLWDIDLLRDLGGNYDQVTAMSAAGIENRIASFHVTLDCSQAPQARWSLKPGATEQWTLAITGMRASATLSATAESETLTLAVDGPELSLPTETVSADWGPVMLELFLRMAQGEDVPSDWTDFVRAFEIIEASHRSVRRKRTIELHFEAHSERSTFKTQMIAFGCALFSVTLLGGVALLIAGQLGLPAGIMKIASGLLLAPLGMFLLLQLLLLIARPARGDSAGQTDSAGRSPASVGNAKN